MTSRIIQEAAEQKTKRLVSLAMAFYQAAETPTANDYDELFTCLVEHDEGGIIDLLARFELNGNEAEQETVD